MISHRSQGEWFQKNYQYIFRKYIDFLKIKSISQNPLYQDEMKKGAFFLQQLLQEQKMKVALLGKGAYPVVYAEVKARSKRPTLMFYGHYDVQPVEPIGEWKSDPFMPRNEGGKIFARGASDDKGQLMYTLFAIAGCLSMHKEPPLNIKILIDSEEEHGSATLKRVIKKERKRLKTDYLIAVDMGMLGKKKPAITLGMRGIVGFAVRFSNAKKDVHSGHAGGVILNPIHAAVEILSKCHDKDGKVAIKHFYDGIRKLSAKEKQEYDFEFDKKKFQKENEVEFFMKQKNVPLKEANTLWPTLEINGIRGGCYAEGDEKTIVPKEAIAKISCRLVMGQDPKKVVKLVENFIKREAKGLAKVDIKSGIGGDALLINAKSNFIKGIIQAYEEVFKARCKKILSGGSIPVVAEMAKVLQCESAMMGVGLDEDDIHAPNENFDMERFKKGFFLIAKTIDNLAKQC